MLIGFGAGKALVSGVSSRIGYLNKEARKGRTEIIHPDLIVHFWFDELRRLGLDHLSVPAIKLS